MRWEIWETDPDDFDIVHPHLYNDIRPARQFIWEVKHGLYKARAFLDNEPIPRRVGISMLTRIIDAKDAAHGSENRQGA